ncbi:MAG: hypothetical protein AAF961_09075, partial [Planctomycetota bacterium]
RIELATPAGDRRELDPGSKGWISPEEFADHLAAQVLPPLSAELVDALVDAHSVVVLVEGKDPAANQRIAEAAAKAIEVALLGRPEWAKPIDVDPQCYIVASDQIASAGVFLWSLGLDADEDMPQLVVLCGRGRPVGPVIIGDESNRVETELRRRLSYVSQDCECELDRSWMHRASFPHTWKARHERQIAARLGFDPGSPLVTAEVRQIVARHRNSSPAESPGSVEPPPLYGYQEFDLSALPGLEEEASEQEAPPLEDLAKETPSVEEAVATETTDSPVASSMRRSLLVVAIVSVLGGTLLLMFAGRNR